MVTNRRQEALEERMDEIDNRLPIFTDPGASREFDVFIGTYLKEHPSMEYKDALDVYLERHPEYQR